MVHYSTVWDITLYPKTIVYQQKMYILYKKNDHLWSLPCLNNVHGELLHYPRRWRRRPRMLKFLIPHYFLT